MSVPFNHVLRCNRRFWSWHDSLFNLMVWIVVEHANIISVKVISCNLCSAIQMHMGNFRFSVLKCFIFLMEKNPRPPSSVSLLWVLITGRKNLPLHVYSRSVAMSTCQVRLLAHFFPPSHDTEVSTDTNYSPCPKWDDSQSFLTYRLVFEMSLLQNERIS